MLTYTDYSVSSDILNDAINSLPDIDCRESLNFPTGQFFYDPWEIKEEYKGTVWETILDSLEGPKGEARLIKLKQGEAYPSHSDLDDRWHLSLVGNNSFLINLETKEMHETIVDGKWQLMNAGIKHTAANFGSTDRIQLVVRKLLPLVEIIDPVKIRITLIDKTEDRRFLFDDIISPWLNYSFKTGVIKDFVGKDLSAELTIERNALDRLKYILASENKFKMEIIDNG
tara:strand:+ start:1881 stop:2564 length:684 start_codon:yes stop_codon:yes gene_type:complete